MSSKLSAMFTGHVAPQNVFVDRIGESEALRASINGHLAKADAGLTGSSHPRANVLVFHGKGGIGKTELAKRLEAWANRGEAPTEWEPLGKIDRPVGTALFDAKGDAFDLTELILQLRRAVSRAVPGASDTTRAFDMALKLWFEESQMAVPVLQQGRRRGESEVGKELTDSVGATIIDLGLDVGLGALGMTTARAAANKLIERSRASSLKKANPELVAALEDIQDRATNETLSELPVLLDRKLQQLPDRQPLVAVFIDHAEYLCGERHREDERLFQRVVHSTPSVLWVILGRNRLEWAQDELLGALDHVGPGVWPGLALTASLDPRQHLVGDLSDHDANLVLLSMKGADGAPAISEDARTAAVEHAEGWPLYLHLCLLRADQLVREGRRPTPQEFRGPFDLLVERIDRDLPHDQRRALRAAALFTRWDLELVAEVADVDQGAVRDLVRRQIPEVITSSWLPYRLHDVLRDTMLQRNADIWTDGDRRRAANRGLDILEQRYDAAAEQERRRDITITGIDLAARFDVAASWLIDAINRDPARPTLIESIRPDLANVSNWGGDLAAFINCWRGWPNLRTRLERFDELLRERPHLAPELEEVVLRQKAYALRGRGRKAEALSIFDTLRSRDTPNLAIHQQQYISTLISMGRLSEAHVLAHSLDDSQGRRSSLLSRVYFWSGDHDRAIPLAESRARHLQAERNTRVAYQMVGGNLCRRSWRDPTIQLDAERFFSSLDRDPSAPRSPRRSALVALARCAAGTAEFDEAYERLEAFQEKNGGTGLLNFTMASPIILHHAVMENEGELNLWLNRYVELAGNRGWAPTMARALEFVGGREINELQSPEVQWPIPEEEVRRRWMEIVERRRSMLST